MDDAKFADELIERLNRLIASPDMRADVSRLIETRIPSEVPASPAVGFLGLLNQVIGSVPEGPKRGWGYILAEYDANMRVTKFRRTERAPVASRKRRVTT